MNIYFTKDVKGANEMVVDCGPSTTLIRENYMKEYMKVEEILDVEKFSCKQKIRLGPSIVYNSMEIVKIQIIFRGDDEGLQQQYVEAFVIQADVPFLLGLNTMKKWRTMVDFESE